jgi:hypothetical protein
MPEISGLAGTVQLMVDKSNSENGLCNVFSSFHGWLLRVHSIPPVNVM